MLSGFDIVLDSNSCGIMRNIIVFCCAFVVVKCQVDLSKFTAIFFLCRMFLHWKNYIMASTRTFCDILRKSTINIAKYSKNYEKSKKENFSMKVRKMSKNVSKTLLAIFQVYSFISPSDVMFTNKFS